MTNARDKPENQRSKIKSNTKGSAYYGKIQQS